MSHVENQWPEVDASAWTLAGVEQQGLQPHDWYRHDSEPRTWLFKPARDERRRAIGEDIAEKLASELARLIGVPTARVELATMGTVRGVLIEDVRPSGWELQHGQVLMSEVADSHEPTTFQNPGHSPISIRAALERFAPPPESDLPDNFCGFDAFTGFLIFDALIAHVDRHDRNWAVLVPPPTGEHGEALCASFDHAASLGFTLSQSECEAHLQAGSVARWAGRGQARRFEHVKGTRWQTLVTLAASAARLCDQDVRAHWQDQTQLVREAEVTQIVDSAPRLAETTREFLIELVMTNRERLLDELE